MLAKTESYITEYWNFNRLSFQVDTFTVYYRDLNRRKNYSQTEHIIKRFFFFLTDKIVYYDKISFNDSVIIEALFYSSYPN